MKALLRAVRRQKPHKNSSTEGHGAVSNQAHSNSAAADETAAAAAPADTNNTPTAQPSGSSTATASVAVLAAATNRLRELAELLDSEGLPAAQNVGAELQVLAQQLLSLPATAATAAAQCAKSSSTAAAPAAAADVESLERSYAAPSAAVAQHAGEVEAAAAATQRLTKKQRRAAKFGGDGQPRGFDHSKYAQRHVVLQLMYVGWSYQGFARQADSDNTIEGVLFPALRRVRLIPEDAEISTLDYSRCGRTDKGVSALGQVLCLKLRSSALAGQQLPEASQELDYPLMINRALPDTIRVLGWSDVPTPDFSARFSCASREYKYFIVQDGTLDVAAMCQAAQHLLGEHDFRNFCKADVLQVQNFMRRVLSVSLEPVDTHCPGMTVLALQLKGTAFLWHQVRCIAAVLLMVGRGLERPEVMQQLLDTSRVPCKPQYAMAAEEPLLLYRCAFNDLQQLHCNPLALSRNLTAVGAQLQQHLVAAALTSTIYEQLQQQWQLAQQPLRAVNGSSNNSQQQPQVEDCCQSHATADPGLNNSITSGLLRWQLPKPQHIPLLQRSTEPSMEERFSKAGISLEVMNQPGGAARGSVLLANQEG